MGYSHPISESWKVIEHRVLIPLSGECKQLVVDAEHSPIKDVIVFTGFDRLRDMTVCDLYPAGLDFTCTGDDSVRSDLYSTRVYIAEEFGLWYKAAPFRGTGLWWTAHGLMGDMWYDMEKLEKRSNELARGLQLVILAIKATNSNPRQFLKDQQKAMRSELTTVKVRIHNIEKFIIDNGMTDLLLGSGPGGEEE